MRVKLHHEGVNVIIITLITIIAVIIAMFLLIGVRPVSIIVTIICLAIFATVLNFFRFPKRSFKGEITPQVVVSSVDGRVVALEEVYEDEVLHANAIQLSVFMSPFNVHANWVPVAGKVTYVKHHNGRFMAAHLPKSSTDNERSTIVIETPGGDRIVVRQIAGAIARRIVTYVEPNEQVSITDFIGFIKFGSRVDIFLPLDTEVLVKLGDRTWGGETLVARLAR
ncbi:MAG: phosphatidylserine decarboxylase family protein [Muribaculaceae bacterium]|nr:phosphatidylserine decarboxylase family protein [Muribaculaceae bacterium]